APSSPPATTSHPGGVAGSASTTNAGRAANATAYGTGESTVNFSGQLYAHPPASPIAAAAAAGRPRPVARSSVPAAATTAAPARVRRLTARVAPGLSVRPTAASRAAARASLDQPTASWLAATVAVTTAARAGGCPTASASSPEARVTAAAGSGCAARISANTSGSLAVTPDSCHAE